MLTSHPTYNDKGNYEQCPNFPEPHLKSIAEGGTSLQDSPSPEAFFPLEINGGRTKRNGRKKNPALLLILKII
jgi:hypothetical protein